MKTETQDTKQADRQLFEAIVLAVLPSIVQERAKIYARLDTCAIARDACEIAKTVVEATHEA